MLRRRETADRSLNSLGKDRVIEAFQLKYKMNTYISICQAKFFILIH